MTDVGAPRNDSCWAVTELMAQGGELLTGLPKDMIRSANRVKTKLPQDKKYEYTGESVTDFVNCSNRQKRVVLYHKLFHF